MEKLQPKDFNAPAILLGGPVDYDMYKAFRSQLDGSKKGRLGCHGIVYAWGRPGGGPHDGRGHPVS